MKKRAFVWCLLCFFLFAGSGAQAQQEIRWLRYPAISPDGSQIVFSYQGDLFLVKDEGGMAVPITRHKAYDFNPVWSPDGKYLAFASDRHGNFDVFRMDVASGKTDRLTYNSSYDVPTGFTRDGKQVLFSSSRRDKAVCSLFPTGVLPELYQVPAEGGRVVQVLTTPAEMACYNPSGNKLLYQDRKGYENKWRKHHTSSVTRDLWVFDANTGKHQKVADFEGEDRNPVWATDDTFYYLSEENGSFNVFKSDFSGNKKAVTNFEKHPVRFLSCSDNGVLAYGYHGDIYTQRDNEAPKKLNITIRLDEPENEVVYQNVSGGATEFAVSPSGKEVAFVVRGDVFVTALEHKTTKQVTFTPEQERSICFSPDGKKILYAGERDGSWNLYEASLKRPEEKYFYNATLIDEKPLLVSNEDTFQPAYSPNGKEVAYLANRTELRVITLKSKKTRVVLPANLNYSYADGDQHYAWSPDGKWFFVEFLINDRWVRDAGLISSDGKSEVIDLTQSGYNDRRPNWAMGGEAMVWTTDRNGYRSHGSWGSHHDVYGMFLTQDAYDKFTMSKAEYELAKEFEKDEKEEKEKDKDSDKKKDKKKNKDKAKKDDDEKKEEIKELVFELDGVEDRVKRLTINSSPIASALLTKDGDQLFYLTAFEKGFNLWTHKFKEKETKLLTKLNSSYSRMVFDKDEKNIFMISKGSLVKISKDGKRKNVDFSVERAHNPAKEREYIFDHAWRQFKEKFYVKDLHGVDWNFYKNEYKPLLSHLRNNYDFAELLSEMLGEANASHTGSGYRVNQPKADRTASLALLYDQSYSGNGVRVLEVLDKSPVIRKDSKIKEGTIIEEIDGKKIEANTNLSCLLNRKVDKKILLKLRDSKSGKTWEEAAKPISERAERNLLYERWVKRNQKLVAELSDGKVGYVHVRGMNSSSFRKVFSDLLGKYSDKEAVVVDTRFNGGGWLHDDLANLLSGKRYFTLNPRGQHLGGDPMNRWVKPSCVIMGEGNYSDAHMFPVVYKTLGIGKLIGMPVAGTGTAVWWETQIDRSLYFGIPQVGIKDREGNFYENNQLEPDIRVFNDPESVAKGQDKQLERAVQEMLKEVQKNKDKSKAL
ncbi:MAG: S41 family peptidase [Cytophagales bacterium]|nr:S41 family peptidase [Cytophagales bacterium]